MDYKKQIETLTFSEINALASESSFIQEMNKLDFNEGFLYKTIIANEGKLFKNILEDIYKPNKIEEAKDFLFYLINNKSILDKKWGIAEGEEDFFEILDTYNSVDKFRKLNVTPLSLEEFQSKLINLALAGSIYSDWKFTESETQHMVSDFTNAVFSKDDACHIYEFEKWGQYLIGFFKGFMIVNLSKGSITFLAKDDYD